MDDYRYEALKALTRARFYAVQNLIREKQRFASLFYSSSVPVWLKAQILIFYYIMLLSAEQVEPAAHGF